MSRDDLGDPRDETDQPDQTDDIDETDDVDETPLGGGIMRRLGAGTQGMAGAFSVLDQFFAPNAHDARRDLEEQRRIGRPAPAPTDPPELTSEPGGRFRGRIVIRRPADPANDEEPPSDAARPCADPVDPVHPADG